MPQPQRDLAAFILTHGRPDNVRTLHSLARYGYTGKVYLLVDDEDAALPEYQARYGDMVKVFSKAEAAGYTDTMDPSPERRGVVYARNAVHRLAREMGLTHYWELDDDYSWFRPVVEKQGPDGPLLYNPDHWNLDAVVEAHLDFLDVSGASAVCMAQGGDFIGGILNNSYWRGLMRKAMNTFFVRTDRPLAFPGRINEDTNMYVSAGNRGDLFFTYTRFRIDQADTQTNAGGLTEIYLDAGTYVKSFYTVMLQPSSVKVGAMNGGSGWRMHHRIDWRRTVPEILPEAVRKPR